MSAEPADPRCEAAARAAYEETIQCADAYGKTPWERQTDDVRDFFRHIQSYALAAADAVITPPHEIDISIQAPDVTPDTVAYSLSLPDGWKVFTLYADGRIELGAASSADEAASEFWECVKLKNPYARADAVITPPADLRERFAALLRQNRIGWVGNPEADRAWSVEEIADVLARAAVVSPPPSDKDTR